MEEIECKIKELEEEKQEAENSACSLLNYGNVPPANFNKALGLLLERERISRALSELKDLEATMMANRA